MPVDVTKCKTFSNCSIYRATAPSTVLASVRSPPFGDSSCLSQLGPPAPARQTSLDLNTTRLVRARCSIPPVRHTPWLQLSACMVPWWVFGFGLIKRSRRRRGQQGICRLRCLFSFLSTPWPLTSRHISGGSEASDSGVPGQMMSRPLSSFSAKGRLVHCQRIGLPTVFISSGCSC